LKEVLESTLAQAVHRWYNAGLEAGHRKLHMFRAWTFVIVGLNLALLFLALLLAGAANSVGVPWRVTFVVVGAIYLLLGACSIPLVWQGGRSALLEEVGASLVFAGSVCLIVAAYLPWLEQRNLFPFGG
jgi:hypothetical protein